jgi:poly(hydroxyalkanoate) granule-associated protein
MHGDWLNPVNEQVFSLERAMIDNVNAVIKDLKTSEFGKATRKSAQVIWKANMNAWTTTRDELNKVVSLAFKQGEKFTRRSRERTEEAVENLSDAANERVEKVEKRFQQGINKVIHDIGLPTADEVEKLSRKVDRLSKEVQAKSAPKRRATPRKKAAAKRRTTRRAA